MKNRLPGLILVVLVLLVFPITGQAQGSRRTVAIVYQAPEQKLADFDLIQKLTEELTIKGDLTVIDFSRDSLLPAPPNDRFRLEELFQWGREIGTRYIIYVKIDQRRIASRKRRSIPLLLSRYIVEGQLTGNYILLDLNRNRLTASWELETTVTGPRQWQLAEDNPDDPTLLLSAPRKLQMFDKLEAKAVGEIFKNVRRHLKGR